MGFPDSASDLISKVSFAYKLLLMIRWIGSINWVRMFSTDMISLNISKEETTLFTKDY